MIDSIGTAPKARRKVGAKPSAATPPASAASRMAGRPGTDVIESRTPGTKVGARATHAPTTPALPSRVRRSCAPTRDWASAIKRHRSSAKNATRAVTTPMSHGVGDRASVTGDLLSHGKAGHCRQAPARRPVVPCYNQSKPKVWDRYGEGRQYPRRAELRADRIGRQLRGGGAQPRHLTGRGEQERQPARTGTRRASAGAIDPQARPDRGRTTVLCAMPGTVARAGRCTSRGQ